MRGGHVICASLLLATACMRPRAPAEFPGDEGRDAVTRALAKLSLSDRAIAPEALCAPSGRGYRAASAAASECSAPPEHWLADPLLRDARRERSFGDLGSADYYRSTVRKLEEGHLKLVLEERMTEAEAEGGAVIAV